MQLLFFLASLLSCVAFTLTNNFTFVIAADTTGLRGGTEDVSSKSTTSRKLEDASPTASHTIVISATERGMSIQNFEYNGNSLIDIKSGGLTPDGERMVYEGSKALIPFRNIDVHSSCTGGGFEVGNLSYDGESPPVNPTARIEEDYDCNEYSGSTIDYLLCTFDLIDICNDASNCELKPGPICSCTK
jgi:hypothetical protein